MKLLYIFLLIVLSVLYNAQIVEHYPAGNDFYIGGKKEFYKDIQEVLLKNNFKKCDSKTELYLQKILITAEGTVKYVKDFDSDNIAKNKCASDMSKEVLKYLHKWKPLEVNGKKYSALTEFYFYPNDFFESYKPGYMMEEITKVDFPYGGINGFRKRIFDDIIIPGLRDGEYSVDIFFDIEPNGEVSNIQGQVTKGDEFQGNKLIEETIFTIQKMKINWTPMKYKGVAYKTSIKLPLTIKLSTGL